MFKNAESINSTNSTGNLRGEEVLRNIEAGAVVSLCRDCDILQYQRPYLKLIPGVWLSIFLKGEVVLTSLPGKDF